MKLAPQTLRAAFPHLVRAPARRSDSSDDMRQWIGRLWQVWRSGADTTTATPAPFTHTEGSPSVPDRTGATLDEQADDLHLGYLG